MHENPNSRWANRPFVASHTFWTSPGGPPRARNEDVAVAGVLLHDTEHLTLRDDCVSSVGVVFCGLWEQHVGVNRSGAHCDPARLAFGDFSRPFRGNPVTRHFGGEGGESDLGVGDNRGSTLLDAVEFADVEAHEANVGVVEQ